MSNDKTNRGYAFIFVHLEPTGAENPQNAEGGILSLSFNTQTTLFSNPIYSPDLCVDESPTSMTVDMSGKFVYVANSSTNNVTACKINQTTGDLNNICWRIRDSGRYKSYIGNHHRNNSVRWRGSDGSSRPSLSE